MRRRVPFTHKDQHITGGDDAFLSTDILDAIVSRLRTTTGPTNLPIGAWADGEFLKRSGATAVGSSLQGAAFIDRQVSTSTV